jgi:hypothetical protein
MKKSLSIMLFTAVLLSACEEDPVDVRDYGLKTFSADMLYVPGTAHTSVAYTQQTFFAFGEEDPVSTGSYGEDSWTDFVLVQDSSAYNTTADVEGWDLAFTHYTDLIYMGPTPTPRGVTGVLLNLDESIQVAKIVYEDSEDEADISAAFASLAIADLGNPDYSSEINAIGYDWKTLDFSTLVYTVNTNWFYIVKLTNGDIYKLRFISFYGTTNDERIIKIEYQLME